MSQSLSLTSTSSSSSVKEEKDAASVMPVDNISLLQSYLSFTDIRKVSMVCKDWNKNFNAFKSSSLPYFINEEFHKLLIEVRSGSHSDQTTFESFKDIFDQFLTLDNGTYTCDAVWISYVIVYELCRRRNSNYDSALYDYAQELLNRLTSNVTDSLPSSQIFQRSENLKKSYCIKFCIIRFVFQYVDRFYTRHMEKEPIVSRAKRLFQESFGTDQHDLGTQFEDFCTGEGIQNFLFKTRTLGSPCIISKTHALVNASPLLKELLHLSRAIGVAEGQNLLITLSNSNEDLQSACSFCEYFETDPMTHIEKPVRSLALADLVQPYYVHFSDQDTERVFELITLANFLDIASLFDLMCAKVALLIKGKTPEEIRRTFNIVTEFTPEEEAQVREENPWIEEGV